MDEKRRAAWKAAIAKRKQGEEVPPEEHCALLRDGMFGEGNRAEIQEEALLFLRYWVHGLNIDPLPWLGKAIAHAWFQRRRRDANRADEELSNFVAADDFDHWTALNLIAARLHRDRERFPDALAEWAAELHEGKDKSPPRERGDRGGPPYAQEDRNRVYYMADIWLQHYAMTRADDRIEVIARYIGDDGSVVRKGLTRWRNPEWRRAPWPRGWFREAIAQIASLGMGG